MAAVSWAAGLNGDLYTLMSYSYSDLSFAISRMESYLILFSNLLFWCSSHSPSSAHLLSGLCHREVAHYYVV